MKTHLLKILLLAFIPGTAGAASVTFSTAAGYDNNFFEVGNPANVAYSAAVGGGALANTGGAATAAIYNTTSTNSGTAGAGGTAVGTPNNNTFSSLRMEMDLQLSSNATLGVNGNSVGFYSKLNSSGAGGYLVVMRLTGTGAADIRVFENADSNGAGIGTAINPNPYDSVNGQAFANVPAGSFSLATFYTLRLDVEDIGATVRFTASIFAQGGSQIGSSVVFTDSNSAVTGAGQVGLRLGSTSNANGATVYYDNFTVNPIPEPSTAALAGLGALALSLRRRTISA